MPWAAADAVEPTDALDASGAVVAGGSAAAAAARGALVPGGVPTRAW